VGSRGDRARIFAMLELSFVYEVPATALADPGEAGRDLGIQEGRRCSFWRRG